MEKASDIIQDFLFKDKPKRSYCNKKNVSQWVELIEKVQKEAYEEGKNDAKKLDMVFLKKCVLESERKGYAKGYDDGFNDANEKL